MTGMPGWWVGREVLLVFQDCSGLNKGPEQVSQYIGNGDVLAEEAVFRTSFSASP